MRVGVIGDSHEPFTLPGYYEWCKSVFDSWGVEEYVHIGDLIDHHALSFHPTETDALGPSHEFRLAFERISHLKKLFPKLKICLGNHDKLPKRIADAHGLPESFIRPLEEVYDFPVGWEIAPQHIIDNVLYTHTATGINGARNLAKEERMSAVAGHSHTEGSVSYLVNSAGKRIFGMYVGCGIDTEAYAMRYGKAFRKGCVLGCGVVLSPTGAVFEPYGG